MLPMFLSVRVFTAFGLRGICSVASVVASRMIFFSSCWVLVVGWVM